VAAASFEVECLPRLLEAFYMRNCPAIDRILKTASEILRTAGKVCEISGYNRSPQDVWVLVSAIWAAICWLNLSYALPPASFEVEGQKIHASEAIWGTGVTNCLDTSLLFVTCLEQAQLHPVIALTENHAFCGIWLCKVTLSALIAEEAELLRKHAVLSDLWASRKTCDGKNKETAD
jgi:hypothetical protein